MLTAHDTFDLFCEAYLFRDAYTDCAAGIKAMVTFISEPYDHQSLDTANKGGFCAGIRSLIGV